MTKPLNALEIDGYKCFERLKVRLAPLTLFTGFNGAGKSTALQPLLLLAQAARTKTLRATGSADNIPLNGEIVRLGSAGDVIRGRRGFRWEPKAMSSVSILLRTLVIEF